MHGKLKKKKKKKRWGERKELAKKEERAWSKLKQDRPQPPEPDALWVPRRAVQEEDLESSAFLSQHSEVQL